MIKMICDVCEEEIHNGEVYAASFWGKIEMCRKCYDIYKKITEKYEKKAEKYLKNLNMKLKEEIKKKRR